MDWSTFSAEAPELAAAVRARFEATKHHVLATLRSDGSPRVSGTEVIFSGDDLLVGSMRGARKARDLQRDSRFALHANPGDGSMEGGDAKVSGTAVEVSDPGEIGEVLGDEHPPEAVHLFRLSVTEAVLTSVDHQRDMLVIDTWHPGSAPRRIERQ